MREILDRLESHDFSARVNVASDFGTFLQAIRGDEVTLQLLASLDDPANQSALLHRIVELSETDIDPRYEHPWDTPLAVYAWALSRKNWDLAVLAATYAFWLPQAWWAQKVSRHILSRRRFIGTNTTSSSLSEIIQPIVARGPVTVSRHTGDAVTLSSLCRITAGTGIAWHFNTRRFVGVNEPRRLALPYQMFFQAPVGPALIESEIAEDTTETETALMP